jgi:hypothetical protein
MLNAIYAAFHLCSLSQKARYAECSLAECHCAECRDSISRWMSHTYHRIIHCDQRSLLWYWSHFAVVLKSDLDVQQTHLGVYCQALVGAPL